MSVNDPINQFVKEALQSGKSRTDIQGALDEAGWSSREISEALSAYSDSSFLPPVPRPRTQVTARDAFVYLLLFTALGFTAVQLVFLIHAIIDTLMPTADDIYPDTSDQIRFAIAALVVAGPIYIWMTVFTRRQIARDAGHKRSLVRKWLTYLSLFITSLFFLGDGIFVIYNFLDGEMTIPTFLKALTIAVVSGAIFLFYLQDVEDMKQDG